MFIKKNIFKKIDKRFLSLKASLEIPKTSSRIENFRNKLNTEKSNILTDTFGRHHTYLRISLTEKCNLRCVYCMPAEGVKLTNNNDILKTDEIIRISKLFVKNGVKKIRLTGGEPTVRRDIIQIIKDLKNIKGLDSVGITTNGLTLTRQLPSLINAGIDALNISLDTLKKERFEILTRRQGWNRVMSAIDLAIQLKFSPIKINCVVMKNFNDDEIIDFVNFTKNHPVDIRFIEYMPFFGNNWEKYKMLSFNEMKCIIKNKYPDFCSINNDDYNSTSKGYHVPGFNGTIGFITSMSEHFCYSCNRLRITADGNLKVCLFEGKSEISLKNYMRNGATDEELEDIINTAVLKKKKQHAGMSNLKEMDNRPMILIGDDLSTSIFDYKNKLLMTHKNLNIGTNKLISRSYSKLSHVDENGKANMVDVSKKKSTERCAIAIGIIEIGSIVSQLIIDNNMKKGDVLLVAKIAGINGAKKTYDLIPLCHQIALTNIDVNLKLDPIKNIIIIYSKVKCFGNTGVEMEALTAVSIAALTVYDMCKAAASPDELKIKCIKLIEKSGGKNGDYKRQHLNIFN